MKTLALFVLVAVVGLGVQRAIVATGFPAADARTMIDRFNASEFGYWFRAADVLAVIEIESAFSPTAIRFEPALGEASIGLMQVLPSTARDRGLADEGGLYDPGINILIGMRQLRWSWRFLERHFGREPTEAEWIGSYNAGVGNVIDGFVPAEYVRRWRRARGNYG